MKCDEEKPSCRKCRSTGRACDGYLPQDSHKKDAFRRQQITNTGTVIIERTPYVGIIGNDQERRGFKFFQFRTSQELASALGLTSLSQFMLQASHANPAVLHAAIALGTLEERFEINSVLTTENAQANNRHEFACRQYYQAVTELRKQLCNEKEHSVDLILISCFLFSCIEFLQGNDAGALMHLGSGLKILRREQGVPTTSCRTLSPAAGLPPALSDSSPFMDDITFIFSVLDVQAIIWLGLESFQSPVMIPVRVPDTTPLIPACFSSLQEAYKSLDDQKYSIFRSQRLAATNTSSQPPDQAPQAETVERQKHFTQLSDWLLATEAFTQLHHHDLTPSDLHCLTVLTISYKIVFMMITVSFQPDEATLYRSFRANFAEIIFLAESLLRPSVSNNNASPTTPQHAPWPLFRFPALLIQPLYFTAVKCRDLDTCRKAISLLGASPWREGAWDSAAMAKIAERKVRQWEEEGGRYGCQEAAGCEGASFAGKGIIGGVGENVAGGLAYFSQMCWDSMGAGEVFRDLSWHGELRIGGL